VGRDRRYDHLYDRQKMPVRSFIVERFAEELASDLAAWPPASLAWEDDAQRARHADALAAPPREAVVRLALALARLDLARDLDGYERLLASEGERAWQGAAERAAGLLLVRFLTERCLDLKERAEGARLSREDLVGALDLVERRVFRVTER
jgi:hypothetical protein